MMIILKSFQNYKLSMPIVCVITDGPCEPLSVYENLQAEQIVDLARNGLLDIVPSNHDSTSRQVAVLLDAWQRANSTSTKATGLDLANLEWEVAVLDCLSRVVAPVLQSFDSNNKNGNSDDHRCAIKHAADLFLLVRSPVKNGTSVL